MNTKHRENILQYLNSCYLRALLFTERKDMRIGSHLERKKNQFSNERTELSSVITSN